MGGFDISYPNYDWYGDENGMRKEIAQQNKINTGLWTKTYVAAGDRMSNITMYSFCNLWGMK